ncbi:hypothetical protein AC844P1_00023 [Anaerostipes phage AC844P1]|nr:hypothetical protein AC844P1_00023 [Anaerostipes phage AC844P1]WAX05293.1 hypothetical protein AC844P2_00023 [Anaerostipes phage AC844P2]WAX05352.1 hypothetical protein AC844P3_00023 [Anaerostipes phage AC844P3]
MADKKDAQVMLAALREEIPIPYMQDKYVIRGIMKGLERLEKQKALQGGSPGKARTNK